MSAQREVAWHVRLAVRPGCLPALRALTAEMARSAATEPGVLAYERYVSADGTRVDVYERYADPASAAAHLERFGQRFAVRFEALVERRAFTVHGVVDARLRALLDPMSPVYLERLAPARSGG